MGEKMYSFEEAQTEAAGLSKKVENGKAKDYPEAEAKMDAGYDGIKCRYPRASPWHSPQFKLRLP